MYFWNIMFRKLVLYNETTLTTNNEQLSILVCAKNECENLTELIPLLLNQKKLSKLIVVDDFSEDNSLELLKVSASKTQNLQVVSCSKSIKGKKQALMDGLSNIKEGLILLTDADCRPASKDWSSYMASSALNYDIVLGFSPYKKTNGFLNRWIRYEAILTAIQYLSFALNGKPYMGVGRNLLYRKSLINRGEALLKNLNLSSGDDDLMINQLATSKNCTIQIDPKAWTYSDPHKNWKSYFNQKRRHLTTASNYKFSHQMLLLLFSASWILFYFFLILLSVNGFLWLGICLYFIRFFSTFQMAKNLFSKLGGKDCLSHWWYLDLFTAIYFLIFSIFTIIPQRNSW